VIESIQFIVRETEAALARAYLALRQERNALLCFFFHSLFRDESEIEQNVINPLQRTTVTQFHQFVEYYLDQGYHFVGPTDVLAGLSAGGKYALITFDDGYFGSALALPILEMFRVPATFFIATDNVLNNKSFWWDVVYRERVHRGASPEEGHRAGVVMKTQTTELTEQTLRARYGDAAFVPRGDVDRPLTPAELRDMARHPLVHLGNHTANHAILTNYDPAAARSQIQGAQDALRDMTGVAPVAIAYPNGGCNAPVARIAREVGLALGFTTRSEKVDLPLNLRSPRSMRLGRFAPVGELPMLQQCRTFRSDLQIYGRFRDTYVRLVGRESMA
jgi:peptidoglycan/xylan/chitin deacetylase (PgdA/CDA1 family)